MTPSHLRSDLFHVLDEILETGTPVEIKRKGALLKISPVGHHNKLDLLKPHPGFIKGDPEDLVHIDWSNEWNHDLP